MVKDEDEDVCTPLAASVPNAAPPPPEKACDGGEPVVFKFKLVRTRGKWLIDDVDYGDGGELRKDMPKQ